MMTIKNEAETNTARMSRIIDNQIIFVMSGTVILAVNQLRAVPSSSEPICTAAPPRQPCSEFPASLPSSQDGNVLVVQQIRSISSFF
jgi:hypothetical protein